MAAAARILELNAQAKAKKDELDALIAPSRAEKRSLNAEEVKTAEGIQKDLSLVAATLAAEQVAGASAPVFTGGAPVAEKDVEKRGFKNHQELLLAVIENAGARSASEVTDDRLKSLAIADDSKGAPNGVAFALPFGFGPRATVGSDEHGEYDNRYGGFAVSAVKGAPRPIIGFEGDPTAGRTENIPMQAPTVEMDALVDKNHTSSVAGGLTLTRRAEAVALSSSRQEMEKITLKATSLWGLAFITEELLADSPASFVARVSNGFGAQFSAHKFNEKLRGTGVGAPLGVLTALASSSLGPTISIAKETGQAADTFDYRNVIKMRSRCHGYGNAIWIANHDCYPQLAVLSIPVGVGGQLVYQQSLSEDRPDMLLGRPIFYSEYANTVGDQGDLILGNWSAYMEGIYQPIQSAESIHVRFLNNERAIRFSERSAGAPSWKSALTPNKSAQTLSPFVVLDAR